MSIIRLSNGGSLFEERFSFPDPDITIRSVFRFEDIKYLKARNASDDVSLVYFYGDRDYLNNLTHYTGETVNSPLARYTSTHSKKEWCKSLKYPVIGMAESVLNAWDTDTRKVIEALVAYKMKQHGFSTVNTDNINWSHGVVIPSTVNGAYADSVANLLVNHQIALLGLAGKDIHFIAETLGFVIDKEPVYEADEATRLTLDDFPNPHRITATEKMIALIKTGRVNIDEPLYTTHKFIHKAAIFRKPDALEYKGNLYAPRELVKLFAHEAFTEGLTVKQGDGWTAYDPLCNFAVERNGEKVRLLDLWKEVQPTDSSQADDRTIDQEWYNLVISNGIAGASLTCNSKTAVIEDDARIRLDDSVYYSLTEFGEAVDGLDDSGFGDFAIIHNGDHYTITSD
jgi:hypothetical protein